MPPTAMISSLPSAISAPVSFWTTVRALTPPTYWLSRASSHVVDQAQSQLANSPITARAVREGSPLCLSVSPFLSPL